MAENSYVPMTAQKRKFPMNKARKREKGRPVNIGDRVPPGWMLAWGQAGSKKNRYPAMFQDPSE